MQQNWTPQQRFPTSWAQKRRKTNTTGQREHSITWQVELRFAGIPSFVTSCVSSRWQLKEKSSRSSTANITAVCTSCFCQITFCDLILIRKQFFRPCSDSLFSLQLKDDVTILRALQQLLKKEHQTHRLLWSVWSLSPLLSTTAPAERKNEQFTTRVAMTNVTWSPTKIAQLSTLTTFRTQFCLGRVTRKVCELTRHSFHHILFLNVFDRIRNTSAFDARSSEKERELTCLGVFLPTGSSSHSQLGLLCKHNKQHKQVTRFILQVVQPLSPLHRFVDIISHNSHNSINFAFNPAIEPAQHFLLFEQCLLSVFVSSGTGGLIKRKSGSISFTHCCNRLSPELSKRPGWAVGPLK